MICPVCSSTKLVLEDIYYWRLTDPCTDEYAESEWLCLHCGNYSSDSYMGCYIKPNNTLFFMKGKLYGF